MSARYLSLGFALVVVAGCGAEGVAPPESPDAGLVTPPIAPPTDAGRVTLDSGVETPEDAAAMPDPCAGVTCGVNAFCQMETGACICPEGTTGDPEVECVELDVPTGFIGSACTSDVDCQYEGAFCLTEADGFPQGICSLSCERLCPDQEGHPVTFCIEAPNSSGGICVSRCDTDIYAGQQGCRGGYQCLPWQRYQEPASIRNTCVPEDWEPTEDCSDPTNLAGSDECYLDAVSFGRPELRTLTVALLEGRATAAQALQYLDLNFEASQEFITDELGVTVYGNYSAGHYPSQPMKGMIVHYTANQRGDPTIRYFVSSNPHASTHFVVGSVRNGLIVQLFRHTHRTWHAGNTYNADRFGFDFANAGYLEPDGSGGWEDYAGRGYSVSLPLHGSDPVRVDDGIPTASSKYASKDYWQPYTYYQLLSFITVGRALHLVYDLDPLKIERHGDVSSSRVDPGPHFPLTALKPLLFDRQDAFQLGWLNDYKVEADWIARHPEAR